MSTSCPRCGATQDTGGGCSRCDPAKATTRLAKTEVSFGPVGRSAWTAGLAGVGVALFVLIDNVLGAHPLAWWVLVAWFVVLVPAALRTIWRPVRRAHRQ